jgi:hypothetical protein
MAREPNPIPITLIAFYASALSHPVMRTLIACAVVAVCGYGLPRHRASYVKYGSLFGRDAWVAGAAWVVGKKKGPNVVSVRAGGVGGGVSANCKRM